MGNKVRPGQRLPLIQRNECHVPPPPSGDAPGQSGSRARWQAWVLVPRQPLLQQAHGRGSPPLGDTVSGVKPSWTTSHMLSRLPTRGQGQDTAERGHRSPSDVLTQTARCTRKWESGADSGVHATTDPTTSPYKQSRGKRDESTGYLPHRSHAETPETLPAQAQGPRGTEARTCTQPRP